MIFETFKLSDITECDYESYAFTMTVGDLIESSHSSNIQRIRNEEKEKGISKFIKKHIDKNKSPFFQPFILHYTGEMIHKNNKYLLDPQDNFPVQIEDEDGNITTELFKFEVIDGNGRLNAMMKLEQYYTKKILALSGELKNPDISEKKAKRIKKQIEDLKIKKKTLKSTKITIQLYLNLDDEAKKLLFSSVNQSEPMSRGRLEVYNDVKPANELLHNYILHTTNLGDKFKYEITVDKDVLRTSRDREKFIPSIYLLPTFKKAIKSHKGEDISQYQEIVFNALDKYINNVPNNKMLRKHFFIILGSVIEEAVNYNESLEYFAERMAHFNIEGLPDVARQQKSMRTTIMNHVFAEATRKPVVKNDDTNNVIDIDNLEEGLVSKEVAVTQQ